MPRDHRQPFESTEVGAVPVDRAIGWTHAAAGPSWGIRAKRTLVDLTDAHPLVTSENDGVAAVPLAQR